MNILGGIFLLMKNIKDIKDRKFYISFIGLVIIFAVVVKLLTMTVSMSDIPTLWVNDVPFRYFERYPLELINGVPYVPITLFEDIKGIKTSIEKEGFYIQYTINNAWILFDTKNNGAMAIYKGQRIEFYEQTFILNGVRYVRAQVVTDNLEIGLDFDEEHGVLRVKDRMARKTLKDLISIYIETTTTPPTIPTVTTREEYVPPTTPPPTTEAETTPTAEPTTAEDTREIINYFMFHSGAKDYANQENSIEISEESGDTDNLDYLLGLLKRENITSIFFLTKTEVLDNPDIVRKIYAMGHELGIALEGREAASEELLAELEEVNSLIYVLTKNKTRFYVFNDDTYRDAEEDLKKKGYYKFKETVGTSNFQASTTGVDDRELRINEMIEFLKREEINIIKFELGGTAENYDELDLVISAVHSKFYITVANMNLPFFLGSNEF